MLLGSELRLGQALLLPLRVSKGHFGTCKSMHDTAVARTHRLLGQTAAQEEHGKHGPVERHRWRQESSSILL